jgi:hypothetical protein
MFDFRQRGDADGSEYGTPDKVRRRGKAHGSLP